MSDEQFQVDWIDHEREPQCPPNPNHPYGTALVLIRDDVHEFCVAMLPYPAARCGVYVVRCKLCGFSVAITTAGRPDDPLSLSISCNRVHTA